MERQQRWLRKQYYLSILAFLPRDAMHNRGLCRHAVSVCLSRLWIMSKRINTSSKFFSPSGSHTILVFPYQTGWRYSDRNPPPSLTGTSNAGGVSKNRDSGRISGFAAYMSTVLSTVRVAKCEKQSRDERRQA